MLGHLIEVVTPIVIHLLELMGILIIIVGSIKAFYRFIVNMITKKFYPIKIEFAQSLTLALEFKLGAEILKTVIVRSMDEMYILAAIIVLRAILAFVIHWEMKADLESKIHN
ncbi:hypothetical protein SDC9_58029 [bioreactor metagenome]|uniref:DUF1622 domain-containing protein n=2 Tax=root TaxID=1 RepID=R9CBU8_9CLOT|nr:DUF1622 domain-containing protein [Clostridium sartagoforme]EOR26495.1 hypothetical protein A500_07966 [Clostridium sartagoforme AAU1]